MPIGTAAEELRDITLRLREVGSDLRGFIASLDAEPGALDDVVWLGDSRRLEMKLNWQGDRYAGTTWTLYVDDVAVGAIEGAPSGMQVAPQP